MGLFGRDEKNWGPMSQQVWHDKDLTHRKRSETDRGFPTMDLSMLEGPEQRPCSPSPAMVTSPYKWVGRKTVNKKQEAHGPHHSPKYIEIYFPILNMHFISIWPIRPSGGMILTNFLLFYVRKLSCKINKSFKWPHPIFVIYLPFWRGPGTLIEQTWIPFTQG
jgi:hypothetical protein